LRMLHMSLKHDKPLISGYVEAIEDKIAEGEKANRNLDIILDETKQMSRLVYSMLDLPVLDQGNHQTDYVW